MGNWEHCGQRRRSLERGKRVRSTNGMGKQENVQRLKVMIRLKTRFNRRDENMNMEVVSEHEMLT